MLLKKCIIFTRSAVDAFILVSFYCQIPTYNRIQIKINEHCEKTFCLFTKYVKKTYSGIYCWTVRPVGEAQVRGSTVTGLSAQFLLGCRGDKSPSLTTWTWWRRRNRLHCMAGWAVIVFEKLGSWNWVVLPSWRSKRYVIQTKIVIN